MSSQETLSPGRDSSQCFRPEHITHAEAAVYAYSEMEPGHAADVHDRWKGCAECYLRIERAKVMRTCCATGNHIGPEDAADFAAGRLYPMDRMHAVSERAIRCESCDGIIRAAVESLVDENRQSLGRAS